MSSLFKLTKSKWLQWLSDEKRSSKNTVKSYLRDLAQWEKFSKAKINPSKNDFRSFLFFLDQKGNNRATVARKISSIKSFYRFASKNSTLSFFEIEQIKSPKLPAYLPRAVSVKDVDKLLSAIGKGRSEFEFRRDNARIANGSVTTVCCQLDANQTWQAIPIPSTFIEAFQRILV